MLELLINRDKGRDGEEKLEVEIYEWIEIQI